MGSPRRRLKTSAQTHCKVYVRPRCRQVQEGADHAPVLLLVHRFSVLVRIQRRRGCHGGRQRLASAMSNFLRTSFVYLPWCTKVPSLLCLIWSPRKKVSSPIMDISNSLLMVSANLATKA